ncbi:10 kDa heat shock protein, mitochondrial, partial [Galemys pyrenaicus]
GRARREYKLQLPKSQQNRLLESFFLSLITYWVNRVAKTASNESIMFPELSQGKLLEAIAIVERSGSGEYGLTKVVLDNKNYFLFRDSDILG